MKNENLTIPEVLKIFSDYLEKNTDVEIVQTKKMGMIRRRRERFSAPPSFIYWIVTSLARISLAVSQISSCFACMSAMSAP